MYEKQFPVKSVRMSSLDKKWFNPTLKIQYKEMQHEFFKNRKSEKLKHLRSRFRRAKQKASKEFYSKFVTDLKSTNPSQYFKMPKKIGPIEPHAHKDIIIECIENMTPQDQVQTVEN